ncbi:MAG: DUF4136 domain-containing protein [Bacteroidota bacterium]|nr:DUF4136 domain-containing protein [Bacteroidota bacterium]
MNRTGHLIIFVFLLFYSCAPKSPTAVILSNSNENADLQKYKSYAWLPPNGDYGEIAILAVENQLESRGYQLDVNNPDFLVAVHVFNEPTDELINPSPYNQYEYRGPGYYSGPFQNHYFNDIITVPIASGQNTEDFLYAEGTIVVDLIDREKLEIVWRGWVEDQRNHPLDVLNDLPAYVDQIFQKFPDTTN